MTEQRWLGPAQQNRRYFTLGTGETFIPIGQNFCFHRLADQLGEEEVLATYRHWLGAFAAQGGNFTRIWLGVPFFNVMPERLGEYSERNLGHIRAVVAMAEEFGVKIKFTVEHFRSVQPPAQPVAETFPGVISFLQPLFSPERGGSCRSMAEFFGSDAGRAAYLAKLRYLAAAGLGETPAVVAWELWNEINSTGELAIWREWSDQMLAALHEIFPRQLALQNLGSFSGSTAYRCYDYLGALAGTDFLQVHRYLDPGAELDICRGPMDVLCADAIGQLRRRCSDKPAVLAEGGAVEANHARYSRLYEKDREGTLLHDVLFAPFFAGSAGSGQCWHWDHLYLDKHDLYWHFGRFARAVAGVDPIAEDFQPYYTETHALRVYGLRGRRMDLLWCRDKASDWRSELDEDRPAADLRDLSVPVDDASSCQAYAPWTDSEEELSLRNSRSALLPPFRRSLVLRVRH